MPDDNTTSPPVLDDIIKPGDVDKAANQPANAIQPSFLSEDDAIDASAASITGTSPVIADDDRLEGSPATATDSGQPMDEHVRNEVSSDAQITRAASIEMPDIDTLTEEILDNLILQIEPLLRHRIQQTLSKHLSVDTGSD